MPGHDTSAKDEPAITSEFTRQSPAPIEGGLFCDAVGQFVAAAKFIMEIRNRMFHAAEKASKRRPTHHHIGKEVR
jgi:hypothetical protein